MDIVTAAERPDLEDEARSAFREKWPEFIFHDARSKTYLPRVHEYFGRYDVLVLADGRVVAGGWGVPFAWDGSAGDLPEGYDGALQRSVENHEAGVRPTAFSFMAAAVASGRDRRGLATVALEELTGRAVADGVDHVVAPLRPTMKHRYPNYPMAEYASWVRPDGLSVDPWIRTHQRMGARVLAPAPRSMVIEGTVAEWEDWTGMVFPVTGDYIVPEALGLVHVDREADRGRYEEENLWVQHR
jgi:hypothetical protein